MDHILVHFQAMHVAISDAKAQLTDLVRRAEAGEEVILTRHGRPAARLMPAEVKLSSEALRQRRRTVMGRLIKEARARGSDGGPSSARSADYLYGEDGLPA